MDRVTRSLIFSLSREDLTNFTSDDKGKDIWISPPDRNSKLKVLREEERFEIRSHVPETSPSKLFVESDDEDDGKYKIGSRQFTPEKVWELEQERKDIIKQQGQRKTLDTGDLINFHDSTDALFTNKEVNGMSGSQITTEVDVEQINFEAARQQFVMLEKKRNSLPITPRLYHRPPRLSTQSLYENNIYLDHTKQKDLPILEQDMNVYKNEGFTTQETEERERSPSLLRKQLLRESSLDSLDSGEQDKSSDVYKGETYQLVSEATVNIPNPGDETPIEREIRLALQREESLRKERGIQHLVESKEIVEIQKNPVLFMSPEKHLTKKKKEKVRSSLFLRREIQREEQREADLRSEGKVAGLYDKGNTQEIDERRKVFEQQDETPVQPQKLTTKTPSKAIIGDIQDRTNQRDSQENEEATYVVDAPLPYSVRTKWKPTPLNPYRTRRLSFENILDSKTPDEADTIHKTSEETYVHKENFQVRPLNFSLHVQEGETDEQNNFSIEKTPESFNSFEKYNLRLRPSRSSLIEEEIRQSLERDREFQEQRKKSDLPSFTESNEDYKEYNQYGKSSLISDGSRTWSPASRKRIPLPYDTTPMFKPRMYPKLVFSESESSSSKRNENWYAGIEPTDAVNTEIVESTRVNRHKSKLAMRWEAGLYANEPSE